MALKIDNQLTDEHERNCVTAAIQNGLAHRPERGDWTAEVRPVPGTADFTLKIQGPSGQKISPSRMQGVAINPGDNCKDLQGQIFSWFPL